MERTIKNTAYQLGTGAFVGTILDSILPNPSPINSIAQSIQVFAEVGAQVAGTILLSDAISKWFGVGFGNGAMDMIPSMMAMMGFQPNLMIKMSTLKDYFLHEYSGFLFIQSTAAPTVGMQQQGTQSVLQVPVSSSSDNVGENPLLNYNMNAQ